MTPDSRRIITLLNENSVEYVVIGGVAMVAHGSAHATFDLDLCYRRTAENIDRLSSVLKPFHPRLRGAPRDLPFVFDARTIKAGLNFTLATDLGDLDLLGEVSGLGFFEAVLAASENSVVFGVNCSILSLEGILRTKIAAGRKKDLNAIEELKGLIDLKKRTGI
jgi:predicted nucleotidyltransferase